MNSVTSSPPVVEYADIPPNRITDLGGGNLEGLTVLENGTSRNGIRRLHVMQVGRPVDLDELKRAFVPGQSLGECLGVGWEEGNRVKRFYARLQWPCREAVRLAPHQLPPNPLDLGGEPDAVMWMLGVARHAPLRTEEWQDALRDAAEAFWGYFDAWPGGAMVNTVYEVKAEARLVQSEVGESLGAGPIRMRREAWVPKRCVVVYG